MNYHLRTKRKSEVRRPFWWVLGFVLIIVLFSLFAAAPFKRVITEVGKPVWGVQSFLGGTASNLFAYFKSKQSLNDEVEKLREESFVQEVRLIRLEAIEKENEELKAMYGRTTKKNLIMAAVLRSPGISPYDVFLIDGGSQAGIQAGAKVYFEGDLLAGYISDVYPTSALVRLYSSPGEKVEVLVGSKKVLTQAEGRGNGNFEVRVPREVDVSKGTVIMVPGISPVSLGIVQNVESDIAHSLQTALFRVPFNLSQTHFLFIEKMVAASASAR